MEFKDKLYQLRREKGYSQEELAMLCNVSRQAISKWENGSANPDLENLKIVAHVLDVSCDVLIGNEDKEVTKTIIYHYGWTKEYRSSISIFGIPLLHINIGRGKREDGKRHVAKGIIAIGNVSFGLISIGMLSMGFISAGILTIGLLFGLGVLSLGYFAVGSLAIGYIAIGAMAIGAYSVGALSIGYIMSIGSLSYGTTAIGPQASTFGETMYYITNNPSCLLRSEDVTSLKTLLNEGNLPWLIKIIIENFINCI